MDYGISEEWSRSGVPESSDADSLPKSCSKAGMTDHDRQTCVYLRLLDSKAGATPRLAGWSGIQSRESKGGQTFYSLRSVSGVRVCF